MSGPVDRERARFCRAVRGSAPGSIGGSAWCEAERMSRLRPLVRIHIGPARPSGKPILTIWNKFDILPAGEVLRDPRADQNVRFSAKTGEGKRQVFDAIQKLLEGSRIHLVEVIPYTESGKLSWIRQYGQLLKEEYEADGIHVEACVPYV